MQTLSAPKKLNAYDTDQVNNAIISCGNGDIEAFTALYGAFFPILRKYFRNRDITPEDTEDFIQITMQAIWHDAKNFKAGTSKNWIFTIAKHKMIDECAKNKTQQGIKKRVQENKYPKPRTIKPPFEAVVALEQQQIICMSVKVLPKEQRGICELFYGRDVSLPKVSTSIDIEVQTAHSYLRKARQSIRNTPKIRTDLECAPTHPCLS